MKQHHGPAGGRHAVSPFFDLLAERVRRRGHHAEPFGGDWPPFGRGRRRPGRGDRLFDRGDLKYVILDLLWQQPRHGYDVIRELEERFGGLYSPSPGTVYPTLQLLEDQGYVSSSQRDGKKIYTVTEAGREFLAEHAATVEAIRNRTERRDRTDSHTEMRALMGELRDLAGTLFRQASRGALDDPERVRRLRGVVTRARQEVEAIFAGTPPPPPAEL